MEPASDSATYGAWRSQGLVLLHCESPLPPRCVHCNAEASVTQPRSLSWHEPAVYLALLAGIVPYAVAALVTQRKVKLAIPLCAAHVQRARRFSRIGWALVLLTPAAVVLGAWQQSTALLIAALPAFVAGMICLGIAGRTLVARRIEPPYAWLAGAGIEYLAALPPLPPGARRRALHSPAWAILGVALALAALIGAAFASEPAMPDSPRGASPPPLPAALADPPRATVPSSTALGDWAAVQRFMRSQYRLTVDTDTRIELTFQFEDDSVHDVSLEPFAALGRKWVLIAALTHVAHPPEDIADMNREFAVGSLSSADSSRPGSYFLTHPILMGASLDPADLDLIVNVITRTATELEQEARTPAAPAPPVAL